MVPRRTAALALMERLRRHEIEAEAQELGRLRAEEARLLRRKDELTRRLSEESRTGDPALVAYLGNFLRSMRSEIARVERDRARIEPDLTALETRISAAFREMKTYETVRLAAQQEARAVQAKREDAEAGEVALLRWWRARSSRPGATPPGTEKARSA